MSWEESSAAAAVSVAGGLGVFVEAVVVEGAAVPASALAGPAGDALAGALSDGGESAV